MAEAGEGPFVHTAEYPDKDFLPPRLQGHGHAAEGGSRSYIPPHPAPLREEVMTSPAHVRFNLKGALRAMVGENQIAVTVHKWKSALTMPQHVPFYNVH